MTKRKLIIAENLHNSIVEKIQAHAPDFEIVVGKKPLHWENHIQDAEIIVSWKSQMKEQCLTNNTRLRWLQSWSAGVNSLPLEQFQSHNIQVTSANGVHAYPISETIFALMLGLTRKIHTYVKNQQSKTWHHSNLKLELHRKTIGIIGVGAIGKETAKIAKAFGMKVLGIRNSGKSEAFVDEMFTLQHLNHILPECDYVVVTVPLTKETRHIIGAKQFQLMKPSAFFINIARGEIVVEQDLIDALQSQQIAGAGLDVFDTEPLNEKSPLWEMENIIITPHSAGSTEHYPDRVIEDIFIPNLKEYLLGKPLPINLVDFEKGY